LLRMCPNQIWKDMTHNVQPTVVAFNTYLNLLSVKKNFTNLLKVFKDIKKQGIQPYVTTYSTLINLFVNENDIHNAIKTFNNKIFNLMLSHTPLSSKCL